MGSRQPCVETLEGDKNMLMFEIATDAELAAHLIEQIVDERMHATDAMRFVIDYERVEIPEVDG